MGLIKTGLKYGALAYVASEVGKAFSSHEDKKQQSRSHGEEKQSHSQSRSQSPEVRAPQHPWEVPVYEENGYVHQRWCSGECGRECRR